MALWRPANPSQLLSHNTITTKSEKIHGNILVIYWQSAPADSSSNWFAAALLKQLLHSGRSITQRAAIAADGFGDEVDPPEIAAEMPGFD